MIDPFGVVQKRTAVHPTHHRRNHKACMHSGGNCTCPRRPARPAARAKSNHEIKILAALGGPGESDKSRKVPSHSSRRGTRVCPGPDNRHKQNPPLSTGASHASRPRPLLMITHPARTQRPAQPAPLPHSSRPYRRHCLYDSRPRPSARVSSCFSLSRGFACGATWSGSTDHPTASRTQTTSRGKR